MNSMPRLQTSHDGHALSSYAIFCGLRAEGIIAPGIRFQASLPTAVAVIRGIFESTFRLILEPMYEEAPLRALKRM